MDLECQCHLSKQACVHGSYKSPATRQLRDDDWKKQLREREREREADKTPQTMQAITRL